MQALLVIDAQNEFSAAGQRPVENHALALQAIEAHVQMARAKKQPIAWVKHYNRPHESRAFVPGTWGAELSPGLGPKDGFGPERLFEKSVYGAFTGTQVEAWLRSMGVETLLVVGFYAHMCVSTTAREALSRDFRVLTDPEATGAAELEHPVLGRQSSVEVRNAALLHLVHMGAELTSVRLPAAVPA